ncbi:hexamerin-like [Bombus vosnesenskii]|uniref:Hexamerin-like n=1 Tax=Bombus vosnesenskii TaxID=207650 RepID=A0A6J3KU43_9HYME|nr:hexamerin-like [Bombus vosnesenskii]
MFKLTLLAALVAICVAHSISFSGSRTADMDFLHKQKKIFDLLLYVRQADLSDAEWYDIGRNYNMETNMDMYKDKNVVQKFFWWYKQGMFLVRDAIFTPFNTEHMYEMRMLFELFYNAKDFQTFYKTACWARLHMNSDMFTTAFSVAVFYRSDCKYMRLPAIYEIYPNYFFDSSVIQEAQYLKMSQGTGAGMGNIETYVVTANYSSSYMMPYMDDEYKLDYFMEDIGINAYYYYIRQIFPFWMSSSKYNMPKEIRGQFYYFIHQQLLARYFLERMSNDLGKIEDFDWNKSIYPGYFSTMMYPNGIPFPQRDRYSALPYYKYKYLKEINALELRIMDAIDSGYLIDQYGKKVDIYTSEGLNILGNVIEGNVDSCNTRFYGMYDALARDILGFNFDFYNKNKVIPSVLQSYCTSMRDPAFYMLYKKIMTYFFRYKKFQPQYSQSELQVPGVKFESVNIDKLNTYFDTCDTLISNAVSVDSFKGGMYLRLKARRACLNYQPFTYKININSDKEMKGMLRIFLGPAFDEVQQDMIYLQKYHYYFVEMDRFAVNLHSGSNSIERRSSESLTTAPGMMSSDIYYDKLNKAISGSEPFTYSERMFGFPERFTLPRGKPEGLRYKMFFFLSSLEENSMNSYEMPLYGKMMFDNMPFGFPLDRPMFAWNYTIPNMFFKDVYIYNRPYEKERMNY